MNPPADDNQQNIIPANTGDLDDQVRHGDLPFGKSDSMQTNSDIPMSVPATSDKDTEMPGLPTLPSLPSLPPLPLKEDTSVLPTDPAASDFPVSTPSVNIDEPKEEVTMSNNSLTVPIPGVSSDTPTTSTANSGLPNMMGDEDTPPAPPMDLPKPELNIPQVEQVTTPDMTPPGAEMPKKKKGGIGKMVVGIAALVLLIGGAVVATNTQKFLSLINGENRSKAGSVQGCGAYCVTNANCNAYGSGFICQRTSPSANSGTCYKSACAVPAGGDTHGSGGETACTGVGQGTCNSGFICAGNVCVSKVSAGGAGSQCSGVGQGTCNSGFICAGNVCVDNGQPPAGGQGGGGAGTTCSAWNVTCGDGTTFSESSCSVQKLFNDTYGSGEGQNHWKTEACGSHGGVGSATPTTPPTPGGNVGLCRAGQTPQSGENTCSVYTVTNGSMTFKCNMRTVSGTFNIAHVWEKCSTKGTEACRQGATGYITSGELGGPGPWSLVCGQEVSGTGTFEPVTCGRVQVDVRMSDGTSSVAGKVYDTGVDCGTAQGPTPTIPSSLPSPVCAAITPYTKDASGNFVATTTDKLSKLKVGDVVRFGVKGANGTFTKARFKVNQTAPVESATKVGNDYVFDYTITTTGQISVNAEVFSQ